jgi:uncharacterized protein YndB with AHSA1/START domain
MKPVEQSKYALEVTTPTDLEIVMKRSFAAPRDRVFDAFTKPELIQRWLLGPDGWSMPVCEVDLKAGGSYRYRWRSDSGDGHEFGVSGTYLEIVRPERLVHAERFDDAWYPGEALVTTTFSEHADSTTVTMRIRYESREARDIAIQSGMDGGVAKSYDRLSLLL